MLAPTAVSRHERQVILPPRLSPVVTAPVLWKSNLVTPLGLVHSALSLLRFRSNVRVAPLLMFGMLGTPLEELFTSVRKLTTSLGGMLHPPIILLGLRTAPATAPTSATPGAISRVTLPLLASTSIGCLVPLVLCVRALTMLLVLMLEIVSSGSFTVPITVRKGLTRVCRLLGTGG